MTRRRLIFTQGDPAGIGPEILLRAAGDLPVEVEPTLLIEAAALDALRQSPLGQDPTIPWQRLVTVEAPTSIDAGQIAIIDPSRNQSWSQRSVTLGAPNAADARGALAALDLGAHFVEDGHGDALVTAPINKAEIARHVDPSFRGHTDHLAQQAGLERYGRDYLMAFIAPDLRVALLSTHVSLSRAIEGVTQEAVAEAIACLARHTSGRIVVAALDPHVGEGGLMGTCDDAQVRPAVERMRKSGVDVSGPESADSLFARVRQGAYEWVLALYHDQGLIAVKTAAFGDATNWTVGLPYLRTSVDHGTAYDIAGRGVADPSSLHAVINTTLKLLGG